MSSLRASVRAAASARTAQAEALYRRAIVIVERALGPEHPDIAVNLNNLAALHHAKQDYGNAELLYRRGLNIKEKTLGFDHPDVATSLNNLAVTLESQGKFDEAETLYRHALTIAEKALGPDHPGTLAARKNYQELMDKIHSGVEATASKDLSRR
ncbi:MAG: tetratricopeptide repeat protein [Methylococcales bacterium]